MTDGPRDFVPPRWGTERRTREEWLDLGGDPKLAPKDKPLWPTLGHQPGLVARRLSHPPMPHQQHVFDVAFELDPATGDLWYSEANVWVMRQCGKTMGILFPVIVHRLTMMPRRMGGRQLASFTMQNRQETRKKLEIDMIPTLADASDSFRRITNARRRPGRSTAEWQSQLNNGSEKVQFGAGNFMLIDTPTSEKSGHGGTLDLKAADELRFGVDDRIEASGGPAQITRRSSQFWGCSTAGDERSFYMWPKVVAGRNRVERQDKLTRVCSFEWALPDDANMHDPEVWYEFHPAAGHTITVQDLIGEVRKAEDSPDETKIDTVRQEHGNQWIRNPLIGEAAPLGAITPAVWVDRKVPASDPKHGACVLAVSVADDGRTSSITSAWWLPDGTAVAKVLDLRPGTFWIERELEVYRTNLAPSVITFDAGGPTNAIAGSISRAAGAVPVDEIAGRAYTAACAGLVTGFTEGRYRHMDQEWLTAAVEGTPKKKRGESWLWDLQTCTADPTPLVGATVAFRALEGRPSNEVHELAGSLMA